MKIFKVIIIIIVVWLLTSKLAFSYGGVVGSVIDNHTGKPLSGVTVLASMQTNILEHKKYEKIKSVSNNSGQIKLSGLHDKYQYVINIENPGYLLINPQSVTPSSGNTVILQEPLRLVRMQPVTGRIVNSDNTPLTNIAVTSNRGNMTITNSEGRFSFPFSLGQYSISISDEKIPDWCKVPMSIDTSSRGNFGEMKLFCTIEKMPSGKFKITSKDGRFVDEQDGIVYDNVKKIAWSKLVFSRNNNMGQGSTGFEHAGRYCDSIRHGDYNKFRRPHLEELTSLNQNGSVVPMIRSLWDYENAFWAKDNNDYYAFVPERLNQKFAIQKNPDLVTTSANVICVQDLLGH